MTEQSVTPEQTARQQTGPASPLVPLVTMPGLQTLDLGALTGMVCDIDDPDCVAPAVPLVTTTDEDEA